MAEIERQPYQGLTLFMGLGAVVAWTSLGVNAIATDSEPSSRALLACAALVLAGFALGSVTWTLSAPIRARRPAHARRLADLKAFNAHLGVLLIAMGADSILDPAPTAWGWTHLVVGSLAGGLSLGGVFMALARPEAASAASGRPTGAPRSGT